MIARTRSLAVAAMFLTLLCAVPRPASCPASEERPAFLEPLRLPTLDGGSIVDTSETRGKKLLLIEFASW